MNTVIGLFVCFKGEVTNGMLQAAKKEGYYKKEIFGNKFDKIQIITVDDLLDYKDPNLPYVEHTTFKKAEREKEESGQIKIKLKD